MRLKFLYNDLVLFYKIANQLVPIDFPDSITLVNVEGTRLTRRNAAVLDRTDVTRYSCSVSPNTDVLRNSFFHRSVKNWNSLPVNVRQSISTTLFKSSLMKYMWSPDVVWPDWAKCWLVCGILPWLRSVRHGVHLGCPIQDSSMNPRMLDCREGWSCRPTFHFRTLCRC